MNNFEQINELSEQDANSHISLQSPSSKSNGHAFATEENSLEK
jgi:hypothetical protein